jgi:hypothetical protein
MGRVGAILLAVAGGVLAFAGAVIALAFGIPALGLNAYGRNPLDETLRGEGSAVILYAAGAALLAIATRWIRAHDGPLHFERFAVAGVVMLGFGGLMAVRGNWTGVGMLVVGTIAILAPIALGGRPWGSQPKDAARA